MMNRQYSYTSKKVKIRSKGMRKILTEGTQGTKYALSDSNSSVTTANVNPPNVRDDLSAIAILPINCLGQLLSDNGNQWRRFKLKST